MREQIIAALMMKISEVENLDAKLFDLITASDLEKATKQFVANVDRAVADAHRRDENGQLFN